jgi:tetratricopeptide (TPR) repeat protein
VTSKAAPSPWLFGPARDLLFGCGLLYAAVFVALAAAGDAFRAAAPLGLGLLATLFVLGPHYGATLLRVYEKGEDRRKYRLFAVWATVALAALFAWGVRDPDVGSWTATVYLTWSPWHYAGQNFGVGMLFLRRRGVEVTPWARRLYWASFALSFALTFLAVHSAQRGASYAPEDFADTALSFRSLGIPGDAQDVAMLVVGSAWLAVTLGAFALFAKKAPAKDLVPPAAVAFSQALWFAVPTLARQWKVAQDLDPFSIRHSHYAFLWIAFAHAAQYLWITSYFAVRDGTTRRHVLFLGKSLLAGAAIWTIPALVFAPAALGRLPYDAGLALLVASFVNLHHFVLDGAIWKLRDGKIARILLAPSAPTPDAPRPARRGLRPALVVAGAACLAVAVFGAWEMEHELGAAAAAGDAPRLEAAVRRLAWIGRDSAEARRQIADLAFEKGDVAAARRQYRASIELLPTARAWVRLGQTYADRGEWDEARRAFDAALALEPEQPIALLGAAVVAFETGRADDGRDLLRRARAATRDPAVVEEIENAAASYGAR